MADDLTLPEAPYSVSDLSLLLKRTIEDQFGLVRVRGEISQPKRHTSGHLYLRLKDDKAVLEAVCWKGVVARLPMVPEEGMDVIATGRISAYPGRSQYQMIIESLELAGEGALLKMLEERKRRLAAEGLFEAARKKPLPFLPGVVGVITSPTGAVIQDILHRLTERFPRRVLLWPVAVQGEGAAAQITAAIKGFNALGPEVPRPDVLIVARGGGSLEDLMPFNDEAVVRAAAASRIPLIAAVGHETDWTLIDLAADVRAPTPTAAAEMAVPVRADMVLKVAGVHQRLRLALHRQLNEHRLHLQALRRGLSDPQRLLHLKTQMLDDRAERFVLAMRGVISRSRVRLEHLSPRLAPALVRGIGGKVQALRHAGQLLESYSFRRVLARGYALVMNGGGHVVSSVKNLLPGNDVRLFLADGETGATIHGAPRKKPEKEVRRSAGQESLF